MESFLSRHRNSIVLGLLVFGQVIGLATQVRRPNPKQPNGDKVRLLRVWAIEAIAPPERLLVHTGEGVRNLWYGYVNLRHTRQENADLRAQVNELRAERSRLYQEASRTQELERLFNFKEQYVAKTVAAQVIGSSGTDATHILYIDKGSNDGLRQEMPVITPDGIVGKVREVYAKASQIVLLNDAQSGVGVTLEKSHRQGIMKGSASGHLEIHYIMADEKVEPGEKVYTSGGDRIFPKGLEVGQVMSISADKDRDGFQLIRVHPNANLFRLEEVLVVTKIEEKTPEDGSQETPAQMLASHLPGIDKEKVDGAIKLDASGNPITPPPSKPLHALAPDRFSPPGSVGTGRVSEAADAEVLAPKPKLQHAAQLAKPATATAPATPQSAEPKTATPETQEH